MTDDMPVEDLETDSEFNAEDNYDSAEDEEFVGQKIEKGDVEI